MRKLKTLLLAAVFVIYGTSAFAADATVTFVSGKVEVQRGGKWVALQKGDTVAKSETISTGFQSEAKIKILDSVMYLGPVTRITLEELSSTEQKDNVNVYLKTGTARSQVKHVDNKRVNYQVHTAVAVASCRGTDWIVSDSNSVEVLENVVAVGVYNELPPAGGSEDTDTQTNDDGVLVSENQSVTVSDDSTVSAPVSDVEKTAGEVLNVITTTSNKESEGGAGLGGGTVNFPNGDSDAGAGTGTTNSTASVTVLIELPADL